MQYALDDAKEFQSTLPARGATILYYWAQGLSRDFNPRSPRGERRRRRGGRSPPKGISIHAPREGSDHCHNMDKSGMGHFNPRSPRGERRLHRHTVFIMVPFQSTLPARGATVIAIFDWLLDLDFNPRSPRGERHCILFLFRGSCLFQSTLPARGATHGAGVVTGIEGISIHAPREGSDL